MSAAVLVYGSRTWTDGQAVELALADAAPALVISGGARGADRLGAAWARRNDVALEVYPADWDTYGKRAGYIRNAHMADRLSVLRAAGWSVVGACFRSPGESPGTDMMTRLLQRHRIAVIRGGV